MLHYQVFTAVNMHTYLIDGVHVFVFYLKQSKNYLYSAGLKQKTNFKLIKYAYKKNVLTKIWLCLSKGDLPNFELALTNI